MEAGITDHVSTKAGQLQMTRQPELWDAVRNFLVSNLWNELTEIYQAVEYSVELDEEDYEPQAPNSNTPKWNRNVRNVLQYRKQTGGVLWDENAKYKLP